MSDGTGRIARGLALPVALLVVWQAWGVASASPRTPVPTHIVRAAIDLIGSGDLPLAIAQSLGRVFAGFAVAAVIAIPLGLAMWHGVGKHFGIGPNAIVIGWKAALTSLFSLIVVLVIETIFAVT